MKWILIDAKSGKQIELGSKVTARGAHSEPAIITSFEPPRHKGSTGRVYLRFENGATGQYFPSVIGAKVICSDLCTFQWIKIEIDGEDEIFYVNCDLEIEEAKKALRENGLQAAPIWVGDPETIDCYANGMTLFAEVE